MLQESDFIPFSTSGLAEGPWLVFAPHADDETFGMGGSLLLASEQDIETHVVVLTDGALGGKGGDELVAVRKKEAAAATAYLGIASLIFWDLPDRSIEICPDTIQRVKEAIIKLKPQTVFFPSAMEIHPDHRATAQLVWEGVRVSSAFSGKAIAYEISVQAPVNYLIDISTVAARKRTAMGFYQSQLQENNYIDVVEGLDRARTYTLPKEVNAAEGFYLYGDKTAALSTSTRIALSPYWKEADTTLPLVSMIVRTKNRPGLLRKALSSLAAQTYPAIDLIVVNDGGEDVLQIVDAYQTMFANIQLIQLPKSGGRSYAANQGLQRVKGQLIGFLDDDDWLKPEHIEQLARRLLQPDNDGAIGAYAGVRAVALSEKKSVKIFNQAFDPILLRIENYIPIHAALFRRRVLDQEPVCRFDEAFDLFEDWDFWLQIMQQGNFIHHDAISAFYRVTKNSGEGVVSMDETRSMNALKQIVEKWYPRWQVDEHVELIGRTRFLSRRLAEMEVERIPIEEAKGKLQNDLLNRDEENDRLRNDLLNMEEERITTKKKHVVALKEVNRIYEKELAQERDQRQFLTRTRSWRITRPLRVAARIGRGEVSLKETFNRAVWEIAVGSYRNPALQPLLRAIPFSLKQHLRGILAQRQFIQQPQMPGKTFCFGAGDKPKVSIIIPVYNHARYLRQCIESALNQSYENIEVVICDDASSDSKVAEILQDYIDHPRSKILFSKKNGGICVTQNQLLGASSGDIVAFLDCDDYLDLRAVEICIQVWREDTVYLHTGRINVDADGKEVNRIHFVHLPRKDYFLENLERMFATHFKLIRRDAFAKVGLFDPRFEVAQDYDLLMRIAFHFPTEAFIHVPEFVYCHRLHDTQTTEIMNVRQLKSTGLIQDEARLRQSIREGHFTYFISIVMLSYGKKEQTLSALESLKRTVKVPHEIILFENGSAQETVDFIKNQIEGKIDGLTVIYHERNLGPAGGRREALKYTKGHWFIVFDNDQIAEPGWLEELLVRASTDSDIGAVCCKVIFPDQSLQFSGGYIDYEDDQVIRLELYDQGKNTYDLTSAVFRECDWCPIGATLFTINPAEFLHQGYPNAFEDAGVSMALKRIGKRLVNSPGSWVWHEHVMYQKKVDMHDRYLKDRYDPKRMVTSLRSFYQETGLIIRDEYVWRENRFDNLPRQALIEMLQSPSEAELGGV